jgi:hypothetical protein
LHHKRIPQRLWLQRLLPEAANDAKHETDELPWAVADSAVVDNGLLLPHWSQALASKLHHPANKIKTKMYNYIYSRQYAMYECVSFGQWW